MSLPAAWRTVYLLDVCTLNPPTPRAEQPAPSTLIHFFTSSEIDDLTGELSSPRVQTLQETSGTSRFFRNDDVLITTRGANLGRAAIAQGLLNNLGASPVISVLRTSPELSPLYLLHFLRQNWFRQRLLESVSGTVQQMVGRSFFSQVKIPLPPIAEQLQIVEVLLKASITPYREALQRTRQLRDAIASSLFTPVESRKRDGARWHSLLEVCEINPRRQRLVLEHEKESVYVVSARDFHQPTQTLHPRPISQNQPSRANYYSVVENDVLFARRNIGSKLAVAVVGPELLQDKLFATDFYVLKPTASVSADYLAAFLRLPWVQAAAKSASAPIPGVQLHAHFFSRLKIWVPSKDRQQHVVAALEKIPLREMQLAQDKAVELAQALALKAFDASLSATWRDEHKQVSDISNEQPGSDEPVAFAVNAPPRKAPVSRPSRQGVINVLSAFQQNVWSSLVNDEAQMLFPDDSHRFEAFCSRLGEESLDHAGSHKEVHRALDQLAVLGLIRKISVRLRVADDEYIYLTGLRAMHEGSAGRVKEDTGMNDAESIRRKIKEEGQG